MTYPNAYSGVKKVFISQILMLIVAVLGIVTAGAGLSVLQNAAATESSIGTGAIAAVGGLTMGIGVISIVAFIINLIGLYQAGKDENNFKYAFFLTIVGLVLSIIDGIVNAQGGGEIFEISSRVVTALIAVYVILGVISIATKLNDEQLEKKAEDCLFL